MNIYTPYFYIIKHKTSGKLYAGSRRAKDCHPSELLKENGYITSSPTIHNIIEKEGIESFEIIFIKTDITDVLYYETNFLITNKCAENEIWLNKHNNNGYAFGTKEFIKKRLETMMEKYGVDNPSKSKELQDKKK